MVPVAESWQGKGLGSGLLKDAMAQFRSDIRATYADAAEFDCIVSHTPAVPGPVC